MNTLLAFSPEQPLTAPRQASLCETQLHSLGSPPASPNAPSPSQSWSLLGSQPGPDAATAICIANLPSSSSSRRSQHNHHCQAAPFYEEGSVFLLILSTCPKLLLFSPAHSDTCNNLLSLISCKPEAQACLPLVLKVQSHFTKSTPSPTSLLLTSLSSNQGLLIEHLACGLLKPTIDCWEFSGVS